jgi:hypothetical protein
VVWLATSPGFTDSMKPRPSTWLVTCFARVSLTASLL